MPTYKLNDYVEVVGGDVPNDFDWQIDDTATVHTGFCEIKPLRGKDLEIARQQVPTVTHRVMMRYSPNISPAHRIRWGKRLLNIDSLIEVDDYLEMMATECRK